MSNVLVQYKKPAGVPPPSVQDVDKDHPLPELIYGTNSLGAAESILSDQQFLKIIPMLWNPSTLSYQVSTGSTAPGADVTVTNFPTSLLVYEQGGFTIPHCDSATQTQDATHDIWTLKLGSTIVATITITYTDATKVIISTIVQT